MTKIESGTQVDITRIKAATHVRAITAHAIRTLTTNRRARLSEIKRYLAYQLMSHVSIGLVDGVTTESVEEIAPGAFQAQRTKAVMLAALEAVHATTDKDVSEYYGRRREEMRAKKITEAAAQDVMNEAQIRATVDGFEVPKGVQVTLNNDAYGYTQITIRTDSGQMWRKWNYESDFSFELGRELAYYAKPKAPGSSQELVESQPAAETALTIADDVHPEIADKVRRIARRWVLKPGYRLEVTEDGVCTEALIWKGDDIFYSCWSVEDDFIYSLDHAMQRAARAGAPE